jgi:hypothetical protein
MKRKQSRKARSAVPAILMFAGSVAVAAISLWPRAQGTGPAAGGPADADPEALVAADTAAVGPEPWKDLLAVHGSWDPRDEVRCAFTVFEFPTSWAAPAGETEAPVGRWVGDDPPQLRLGVVLVSENARRAVLGGQVVGIGDAVQQAKVTGIERGLVTVTWSGRRLTYDLDGPVPREFRAEVAARAVEKSAGGGVPDGGEAAGDAAKSDESVQKESGK